VTENRNSTQLDTSDTAPEEHSSFVDNGAEHPEAPAAEDATGTSAQAPDPETTEAESGEDFPAESEQKPPQTAGADSTSEGAQDGVPGDEDYLPPGQTEVPVGDEVVIDDETMRRALEAILMVTDEPLPVLTLARAVGRPTGDVSAALAALSEEYTEQGRGFDLREVGGGWRYYTRVEAAPYVERFVLDGQQARLTQAALETLAVVAYKQPVSRARVSAIRGVNVDGVMRTLVARGLVEEAGADTESQATLYRTTSYFLERMGMQSLDDLPELAPYLPEMNDIEEELAAQTLPAPSSEGSTDEPAGPEAANALEPVEAAGTAENEGSAADEQTADDGEPTGETDAAGEERAGLEGDVTNEDAPADDVAAADSGIDGDLTTDEPVELDLAHEPGELDPSDEVEPAENEHIAAEDDEAEGESAGVEGHAGEQPGEEPSAEDGAAGETGIDGDLSTGEAVELDLEHEPGELEPSDEVEPAGADESEPTGQGDRDG
jgi:segregation and condensation protein B